MLISHVISSIDKSIGGPARSSTSVLQHLSSQNSSANYNLITYVSQNPQLTDFNNTNADIIFVNNFLEMYNTLKSMSPNLFHAHGIWEFSVNLMSYISVRQKIPYVISTRGMLEPWSLNQKKFKKKIALLAYQYKNIANSDCIHATSKMEAENLRKMGFKNPIAIIPNGVNIDFYKNTKINKSKSKKILFLSRIHKKKGLEILIDAWSSIEENIRENWTIEIVGNGSSNYIKFLHRLIEEKNLKNQIFFSNPVYGKEKLEKFFESDFMVLPTFSENFGIVVAEALSTKLPVITTLNTPWDIINEKECGICIELNKCNLINAIVSLMLKEKQSLIRLGENGRNLIKKDYNNDNLGIKMNLLYEWLLGRKPKPNFVYL